MYTDVHASFQHMPCPRVLLGDFWFPIPPAAITRSQGFYPSSPGTKPTFVRNGAAAAAAAVSLPFRQRVPLPLRCHPPMGTHCTPLSPTPLRASLFLHCPEHLTLRLTLSFPQQQPLNSSAKEGKEEREGAQR